MCGRFSLTEQIETLSLRFKFAVSDISYKPRYNIAPSQQAVVVVQEETRVLKSMRWGLIPAWAKDKKLGYKMINARAETISTKPSYKRLFLSRRCLVLADGYYEWQANNSKQPKIPFRITIKSKEPFAFAGIYDIWNHAQEEVYSFSIVTTQANHKLRDIHNRMPVVLQEEQESQWLAPDVSDISSLEKILQSTDTNLFEAYRVSTVVNSPKNDTPACVEPVVV